MTEQSTSRRNRITPRRPTRPYEVVLDLVNEVEHEALPLKWAAGRTSYDDSELRPTAGVLPALHL